MKCLIYIQILGTILIMKTAATLTFSSMNDQVGVTLSLHGSAVANNSYVNVADIGNTDDSALLCCTNKSGCCGSDREGQWYFPDGMMVPFNNPQGFRRDRGDGVVRLKQNHYGMSTDRGLFYCEVPDANNKIQTVYVHIVEPIMITGCHSHACTRTTAEIGFALNCSANALYFDVTLNLILDWLFDPANKTLSPSPFNISNRSMAISGNNGTYTSILSFPTLQPSHAGKYTCKIRGTQNLMAHVNLTVKDISVNIFSSGNTTLGHNTSLTCIYTEDGLQNVSLDTSLTYQWTKANKTHTQVRTVSHDLSFAPLRLSDAGNYTCQVTVDSNYHDESINITAFKIVSVKILVRVDLSHSPLLPDLTTEGECTTFTCTVELGPPGLVDSDLSLIEVHTQLYRDGAPLVLSGPTEVNDTTLTYSTQLDLSVRNNSENYTCTATVSPRDESPYIDGSTNVSKLNVVSTGVYISHRDKTYANNSNILTTDIGEGDSGAVLCKTNLYNCCKSIQTNNSGALGAWLYPNSSSVPTGQSNDLYNNRDRSVVRLNHRGNSTQSSPTGKFCCRIPDASYTFIMMCVNLVTDPSDTTVVNKSKCYSRQPSIITSTVRVSTMRAMPASEAKPNTVIIAVVAFFTVVIIAIAIVIIVVTIVLKRRMKKKEDLNLVPLQTEMYCEVGGQDVVESRKEKLDIIRGEPPKIDTFPSDSTVVEGKGVYFEVKVSGVPQPTVTWYHNGEPVEEDYAREIESDGSLAIPSTELKHSGVYKLVVDNSQGREERELVLTVKQEGNNSAEVTGDIVSSRPVPLTEYGKYVSELHSNNNQPFKDLYECLDSGTKGHKINYATHLERNTLNRFGNIVVYDDNRIVLKPIPNAMDCQGDYINACYIDGYSTQNRFIATQGPLPTTLVDFWRLVWQEHPPTIVMVTNIKESNRTKCHQYWPDSGKVEYGPFQVTITDQQIFADYTIRTLSVSLSIGASRRSHKVIQFHYTAWPDHGVPSYATSVLAFHRRVKAQHNYSTGPMVVHCSAGIGRTGTFIVIDHLLEQIAKEKLVDIPGVITEIRRQRMMMVQTVRQFIFIHDAILESVTCGDTQITVANLRAAVAKLKKKNGFQKQMTILEQVSPNPKEVQCSSALSYPERNRGKNFLPAEDKRVILQGEQPDYIHAITVDGYKHKKAFIIAEGPMESTVRNFWKMIYDRKCAVVVMVSDLVERGEESSTRYWPSSGVFTYGEYTVDLIGEEPLEGFTIRDLSVMEGKSGKPHKVTQFHITCWSRDGRCSILKSITDVIEEMTKVQIGSGNRPIVVHCNDTVTRSGMFCAIATTIERCKTEGVVDVFQVVKALRVQKPGAVPNVDHYRLIFNALLVYLESFDTYANFQNI